MAVELVTIHHEAGPGPLPTAEECDRFAEGGYCYGIGTDTFRRWRAPEDNWATMNYNGQDLTLCFGGDRHTEHDVSDHDLAVLHDAYMDSYNRGEVTAAPQVRAHRDSPGSSTACPGDRTMGRWAEVEAACRPDGAPTEPPEGEEEMPMMQSASVPNADGRAELWALNPDGTIWKKIRAGSGGGWSAWQQEGSGFDGGLSATANENGTIEVFAHHATRGYLHRWQTAPNNGWSDWADL